jgi:uncharacterized Zn finger protein
MAYYDYPPYVPAAERRRRAEREIKRRRKNGETIEPVALEGRRAIARTFWGSAWCAHLEGHSDFANRLPRGRTYVRNGSVLHLAVGSGRVDALVQGTELYEVGVTIDRLAQPRWRRIIERCSGEIDSLVELLQGRLSNGVMKIMTDRDTGLFPAPAEIAMTCSCPDWATMCKHVAAALYGIGARLDARPELLFVLRGVDQADLVATASLGVPSRARRTSRRLADDDLAGVFGVELDDGAVQAPSSRRPARRAKEDGDVGDSAATAARRTRAALRGDHPRGRRA